MEKDPRALNARGYIYYHAPDLFETDPALLNLFGKVRKDLQKALVCFKKAAHYGSLNAKYNMGALYLTGDVITLPRAESNENVEFSYSSAYEYFRKAAEEGHTLAAYNLGVMHFTGLGTYQSCSVANTFIQHVADVGYHTQGLKEAHRLVQQKRYLKATLIYMELAEMGLSTAMLNTGLLLNKYSVFDSQLSYFATDVEHEAHQHIPLDINKYLSFNYFKMSVNHPDTRDEALIKLGDHYYYGVQPLLKRSYSKAAYIYKYVE